MLLIPDAGLRSNGKPAKRLAAFWRKLILTFVPDCCLPWRATAAILAGDYLTSII